VSIALFQYLFETVLEIENPKVNLKNEKLFSIRKIYQNKVVDYFLQIFI